MPKVTISENLGVHRETVGVWISRIKKILMESPGFFDEYINAKKGETETGWTFEGKNLQVKRKQQRLLRTEN
jgi:hypothetical protein